MQSNNYSYQPGDTDKMAMIGSADTPFPNSLHCLSAISEIEYKIEKFLVSHPSHLFFVRETITGKQFVIKILIEENKDGCNLLNIKERQAAQLYALQWNKSVTPDVYLGLARIVSSSTDYFSPRPFIKLDHIIACPVQADFDDTSEYALVMERLHKEKYRRLSDMLEYNPYLEDYMMLVVRRIAEMHRKLKPLHSSNENGEKWGGCQQIQRKLQGNIDRAKNSFVIQPERLEFLSALLLEVFQHSIYQRYFEQRRLDGYIRNCHGDLKTENIWIDIPRLTEETWQGVKILDAIDFNREYSNIDILSDFAMLVVDIHAHANSRSLVEKMIEWYLELTKQKSEVDRFVLDYYLLEKALVRASMRSASENLREPDQTFLELANEYRERLLSHMPSRQLVHV